MNSTKEYNTKINSVIDNFKKPELITEKVVVNSNPVAVSC